MPNETEPPATRLAWRYLASRGLAPLAPTDPLDAALARLTAEAEAERILALRDLAWAGLMALAAASLLLAWLLLAETGPWWDIGFRIAGGMVLAWQASEAGEAARRWWRAAGLRRAACRGQPAALAEALLP